MILRGLLLGLLALGLTAGQNNDTKLQYLVTAPAIMTYPSNQTICVFMRSPEVEMEMNVSLVTTTGSILLTSQKYQGEGLQKCDIIQVPPVPAYGQEIANITVKGKSGDYILLETKSVIIRPLRNGIFVQTDRPIYQPGEKIFIRAVDFTEDLFAKNEMFSLASVQDSNGNNIYQWKNIITRNGIMELTCNLSPGIALGDYTITVQKDDNIVTMTVTVDTLALPRFDFTIDAAKELTILESNFPINMCGKYTYGKPVRGTIIGKLCRLGNIAEGTEDICMPINGEPDVHGCYTVNVNTSTFQFRSYGYNNYLDVEASLEEEGTGVERVARISISITTVVAKVQFKEPRSTFKVGLAYRGQMILTGADGHPIPDENIELYVNGIGTDDIYTTDENGIAKFSLDTSTWENKTVDLRGHYIPSQSVPDSGEVAPDYDDGYAALIPYYTRGKSQLKIRNVLFVLPCNEKVNLWADFVLDPSEYSKESIDFFYMVFAKGQIIYDSRVSYNLAPNSGLKGFLPFPVGVTSQMSPAATILAYAILSNGDLLADSIKIPVSSCFPNTVSLQFSEEQSLPGSMLSLHISAYPNSLCNVRAVDKSVELLKAEDKLPEDTVNEILKAWDIEDYPIEIEELQQCPAGTQPISVDSSAETDTFTFYKDSGMKVLTSFKIKMPLTCESVVEYEKVFAYEASMGVQSLPPFTPAEQVRKEFPATWLMDIVLTGPTGQLDYALKTPDTITQWNVDAFCTATIGLGFSPRTSLQVFQPLHLEVILPISVKQGETMMLKAIVLNFLKQCMKVKTTLYKSEDFRQEPCANCSYTACLCDEPTYTFTWAIKPTKMGTINITIGTEALDTTDLCNGQTPIVPSKGKSDIVQRSLIVEPNGLPVENTRSFLLCAYEESEKFALNDTEDVVLGSKTAEVTVTGDIMGRPLDHLDNLLQLPHGCGEQNMIKLGPVIATILYFSITGQLTDEISEKAQGLMEEGYQNELNFRHTDGSYSAFGNKDPSGNSWLTAFVARVYFLAEQYISVNYTHISECLNWLKSQQQEDGCFKNVGSLIHRELQGGVDSATALTAYITATFVLIGDPQYDDVINKAKTCLGKCTEPESSTYTKAQCAYTFTLLGDTEKRTQLLKQLNTVAIEKDNTTHWSKDSEIPKDGSLQSADVETTSYMVLALLSYDNPSSADLGAAVPVVHWLSSVQNANGGFVTTTDTIVGIFALSIFAQNTYTAGSSPVITVTNDKGFSSVVLVNPEKLMDMQYVQLPDIPAEYTLEASGVGCAYVQVTERYNVLEPKSEGIFSLSVNTIPIRCSPPQPAFTIDITASYNNSNEESSMAIIVVQFVSGYAANQVSLNQLLANELVKKTETSPSKVVIYLQKVGPNPVNFSFQMEQQSEVTDLKPAQMSLIEYYNPSHRTDVSYNAPCN